MRPTVLVLFFISNIYTIYAQTPDSLSFTFGSDNWDGIRDIAVDNSGNTVVTGYFNLQNGHVPPDLDPSDQTFPLTKKGTNFLLAKYDSLFNLVWAFDLSSTASPNSSLDTEEGSKIAIIDNYIYVLGTFMANMDFDPGPNNFFLMPNSSTFEADVFLAKYDSDGNFVWARYAEFKAGTDVTRDLEVLNDSTLLFTGETDDTVSFFGLNDTITLGPGSNDSYVFQISTDGEVLSGNVYGTPNLVARRKSYSSGYFITHGDNWFGYGDSISLMSMDNNNHILWQKTIMKNHGTGLNRRIKISDFELDKSFNICIAGSIVDTCDFNPTGISFLRNSEGSRYANFIAKYDSLGNFINVRIIKNDATPNFNYLNGNEVLDLEVDSQMNIYFGGFYSDSVYFNDHDSSLMHNITPGIGPAFICKYDENLDFQWAYALEGSTGTDWSNVVWGIDIDQNGNAVFAGGVRGPLVQGYIGREGPNFGSANAGWGADAFISRIMDPYKIDVLTAIHSNENHSYVNIFPNPSSDIIKIQTDAKLVSCNIYDLTGKHLQGTTEKQINISALPNGVFIISVNTDQGVFNSRIIKN